MAYTYEPTTDRGKVRLLVGDRVTANAIFDDEEIDTFLTMQDGNVNHAAALALESAAGDPTKLGIMFRTLNFTKDTKGVVSDLLKKAERLRNIAPSYGAAETVQTDQSVVDIVTNAALRDQT